MNPIAALAAAAGLGPSDPVDGANELPPIKRSRDATKKLYRFARVQTRRGLTPR